MMLLSLYLLQTIIGIFIWKKILFNKSGFNCLFLSIVFSAILIPNAIYLIALISAKTE